MRKTSQTLAIKKESHECLMVFGTACISVCDGQVEKSIVVRGSDRASLRHGNVEFRIGQDGADL